MVHIRFMNASEITRFSSLIRDRMAEIETENRLGKGAQAVVELDQQSVGRLSRMDALQNQAMALAQQARRDIQMRRLKAALVRIERGEFGYCQDCGDDIALKRLDLDPSVTKCITCASG